MDVEQANGFYVIAALIDRSENVADIAAVEYDLKIRAWQVKLTAPRDHTKQYEISVSLVCGGKESPCTIIYGNESMANKVFPVQIH